MNEFNIETLKPGRHIVKYNYAGSNEVFWGLVIDYMTDSLHTVIGAIRVLEGRLDNGSGVSSSCYLVDNLRSNTFDYFTRTNGSAHKNINLLEVYDIRYSAELFKSIESRQSLIWKKPIVKKITVSEIENILGYKVEIINERC